MPIDYSPLSRPTQSSGVSRGLRFFGDAVSAVLERRQRMQIESERRAAEAEQARMLDARAREGLKVNAEIAQEGRLSREHNQRLIDEDRDAARELREAEYGPRLVQAAGEAARTSGGETLSSYLLARAAEWQKRREAQPAQPAAAAAPAPGPPVEPGFTLDEDPTASPPAAASRAAPPALPQVEPPPPVTGPPRTNVRPEEVSPPPLGAPPVSLPAAAANRAIGAPSPGAAPVPAAPPASLPQAVAGMPDLSAMGTKRLAADWYGGVLATKPIPEVTAQLPRLRQAIEGGMPVKDADARIQAILAEVEQNKRAAADRALREEKDDLDKANKRSLISQRYLNEAKGVLDLLGYKNVRTDSEAQEELRVIAGGADQHAALATLLRGRWAKFGQGAGVLTDHDLSIFYERLGGIAQQFGTTVSQMLSGVVTPEVRKEIEIAIDVLRRNTEARQTQMAKQFSAHFNASEDGRQRLPAMLQTFFPAYWERQGAPSTAPALPGRAPAAPKKKVDTKAIDAAADELERELGL